MVLILKDVLPCFLLAVVQSKAVGSKSQKIPGGSLDASP